MDYFSKSNQPKNLKIAAFWVSTISLIVSALWIYITQENHPAYHINLENQNTYTPNTGNNYTGSNTINIVNNSVTIDNSNTMVTGGGIAVSGNNNTIISTTDKNNN